MINFESLSASEITDIQSIISKNTDKSELEKYYLYTHDVMEKAKLYIWCFRFLYSVANLSKGNLKEVLRQEINDNLSTYIKVNDLYFKAEKNHFNRHRNLEKLRHLVLHERNVEDLIDTFALLLEKTSVLTMSRLKGIVLEGQSANEYKKIFDAKVDKKEEIIDDEILEDEDEIIENKEEIKSEDSNEKEQESH